MGYVHRTLHCNQVPFLYDLLTQQSVTFIRFENREFGHAYPYGNKIEALEALPVGEPFVFLTVTL